MQNYQRWCATTIGCSRSVFPRRTDSTVLADITQASPATPPVPILPSRQAALVRRARPRTFTQESNVRTTDGHLNSNIRGTHSQRRRLRMSDTIRTQLALSRPKATLCSRKGLIAGNNPLRLRGHRMDSTSSSRLSSNNTRRVMRGSSNNNSHSKGTPASPTSRHQPHPLPQLNLIPIITIPSNNKRSHSSNHNNNPSNLASPCRLPELLH